MLLAGLGGALAMQQSRNSVEAESRWWVLMLAFLKETCMWASLQRSSTVLGFYLKLVKESLMRNPFVRFKTKQ